MESCEDSESWSLEERQMYDDLERMDEESTHFFDIIWQLFLWVLSATFNAITLFCLLLFPDKPLEIGLHTSRLGHTLERWCIRL